MGIRLYDFLARGGDIPKGQWLSADEVTALQPRLLRNGLLGAYASTTRRWMTVGALGTWVVEQFCAAGGTLQCEHEIVKIDALSGFDRIVNATGPWALDLRKTQPGRPAHVLDWGSRQPHRARPPVPGGYAVADSG